MIRNFTLALLLAVPATAQIADYDLVDNFRGDWVNQNPVPVRPLAYARDGLSLFACNPYHHEIVRIGATLTVERRFRTMWGPVGIAPYADGSREVLLVVCQHSNAVVVHDVGAQRHGDILRVIPVPAEPADIVVDARKRRAFVSCTATDEVVEIDLTTWKVVRSFRIASRVPTFLSTVDHRGSLEVFVAPRWSGNNTAVHRIRPDNAPHQTNVRAGPLGILDLSDPNVALNGGLPDHDLFWLDRSRGEAVAVARSTGTLLFAHGMNPKGGYWQLNTDANNKHPLQTEEAIRGDIVRNRVSIVPLDLDNLRGPPIEPGNIKYIDLDEDPNRPGHKVAKHQTVGMPYCLAFASSGAALVFGLLTRNVLLLDKDGKRLLEIDLPNDAAMPRGAVVHPSEAWLAVYTGDNQVHVYPTAAPWLHKSIDVGFDPTPEEVREGRALFFDGSNSLHGNASCASCHDEGKQDLIAWNLSDGARDDKGPMTTQTLVGIERLVHFHWRGEQRADLLDFNGAFDKLLGGKPLATGPGSEFDKLEQYVFSLTPAANPFQNPQRKLDDKIRFPMAPGGNAVNGQAEFKRAACTSCHRLPNATGNDTVADGTIFGEPLPKRQFFKVAPFHNLLPRGLQPDITVTWSPQFSERGTQLYPLLGTGLGHSGNPRNLAHFLKFFDLNQQARDDISAFLYQFDLGVAPAAHAHVLLNRNSSGTALPAVRRLIAEAKQGNCDVVVFGRTTIANQNRVHGWAYWPKLDVFLRDDAASNTLQLFLDRLGQNSNDWFVFLGAPLGSGIRRAIDFDMDLYPNGLEDATRNGAIVKDTDGDGFEDGHEWMNSGNPHDPATTPNDKRPPTTGDVKFEWSTGTVTRLTFDTSELTKASVAFTPRFNSKVIPTKVVRGFHWRHSIVVGGLHPNGKYTVDITLEDQARPPNRNVIRVQPVSMKDFNTGNAVIVGALQWGRITGTDPIDFEARVRVDRKQRDENHLIKSLGDHIVVARVLVDGVPATASQLVAAPNSFRVEGTTYKHIPGPFVISRQLTGNTGAQLGWTNLSFRLKGIAPGSVVELSIEAVGPAKDAAKHDPDRPNMEARINNQTFEYPINWSFPDTPKRNRLIRWTKR